MADPTLAAVTLGIRVTPVRAVALWYEELFGREPDREPIPGVREWELRPGFHVQVFEGKASPSTAMVLRLGVPDIDAARERLVGLGVDVSPIERVTGVIAICDLKDPCGNRLSLYQSLG